MHVGARVKRVEDGPLLRGAGRYVDDLVLPGMLHVAFVRSTHAHARVLNVDVARARALPGVVAVVTAADFAGQLKPLRTEINLQGFRACDMPVLAAPTVRYVGEPVAAVVATSAALAADAVGAVQIEYEPLEALTDAEAAARPSAPRLHHDLPDNVLFQETWEKGDWQGLARTAAVVVEDVFRHPRVTGVPMEPRGCVAHHDAATAELTFWSSTQIPHILRTWLADSLGFPENRLRVIAPDVGGGFGIKLHVFPEEVITAALAVRLHRPVKWIETRREHIVASRHAREQSVGAALAVAADGTLLGLRARIYVDVGAYSAFPGGGSVVEPIGTAKMLSGPYRVGALRYETYGVATNKAPTGPYRGVSYPVCAFVMESLVDMAAARLGLDPFDMRQRNLVRRDEFPYTAVSGMVYDAGSYVESLERAATLVDYHGMRKRQAELLAQGRYLGIGLATYCEPTGVGSQGYERRGILQLSGYDVATVTVDPSGRVTASVGVSSHGQGLQTTLAQLVADELGVPLPLVTVVQSDTARTPYGMGTFASRSAVIGGGAVVKAARQVRDKALRIAGRRLEAAVEDLVTEEGRIFVRGAPHHGLTYQEVARLAYYTPSMLPASADPGLEATQYYDPPASTFSNATHAAVVEVDSETGSVTIATYAVVEDCGTMINPLVVDGQVHGGVAQGIGPALFEELRYDGAGQPLTATLMDYVVPTAAQIPAMTVEHIETPSPWTINGMKGMGEGGTIGATAVVARAVADALRPLGVRVNTLPLTPERVHQIIQAATPIISGQEF